MGTKVHSQVIAGARHAIHNLEYPNAANRIAGTGEGSGINPPTFVNLYQIAKQDDDDSLWMLTSVSPLTWVSLATGDLVTLDFAYNAFGSNPSTIVVDGVEGQGDSLTWDMTGDRFFEVDLANGSVPTGGDGIYYHSGFRVVNGIDDFKLYQGGSDSLIWIGNLDEGYLDFETSFEAASPTMSFNSPLINFTLPSSSADGSVFIMGTAAAAYLNRALGVQSMLSIIPKVQQSGTAGYNGLLMDVTESSTGSGENNLINLKVGGNKRFRVDNDGNSFLTGDGTERLDLYGTIQDAAIGSIVASAIYTTGSGGGAYPFTEVGNLIIQPRSSADRAILFYTGNGTPLSRMVIDAGGQVGVGTTDLDGTPPSGRLVVKASSNDGSTNALVLRDSDEVNQFVVNSEGNVAIGTGTPGLAVDDGDLYVTGRIEVDGIAYFDSLVRVLPDQSIYSNVGVAGALIMCNTSQAAANPISITTGSSNYVLMCEYNDRNNDFGHGAQTNPTLFIQSANQSATEWISLLHDQTNGVVGSGTGLKLTSGANYDITILPGGAGITVVGDAGSTSHSLAANDDLFVSGKLEVDGTTYFDSNVWLVDQTDFIFGTGGDASIRYSTSQTADTLLVGVSSDSNHFLICQNADKSYDFAHSVATDPTVFIQSANQSATEWLSLSHDQTDGVLATGAGALSLGPASGVVKMPDTGQILWDVSPASDETAAAVITSYGTVDVNLTGFGAAMYQDSDGDWREADADSLSTMPCRAIALESGTGTKLLLRRGWIRDDSWSWTPGSPVYVSTSGGGLTQTKPSGTGDQVQIVGYAETADIIDFNPSSTIVEVA